MSEQAPGIPVWAVVVEYHSGECLTTCVSSLLADPSVRGVVVVDNGSRPTAGERLADLEDARLTVLPCEGNPGFAGGVVRASREVPADAHLLIVNPDCEMSPRGVGELAAILSDHPDVGLVAPLVVDAGGRTPASSTRPIPSLESGLLGLFSAFSGAARTVSDADDDVVFLEPGTGVSGACLLVSAAFRNEQPVLDDGFFMHFEDLDLMRRVQSSGRRIALHRGVEVRHMEGVSSRRHPFRVHAHKHLSMWRYLRKHDRVVPPVWLMVGILLFMRWLIFLPVVGLRWLRTGLAR